jgi:lipopolysaccharide transport system ATP-binding protein
MSGDVVIRAEGLGKKYIIGHAAASKPHTTFREETVRAARKLAGATGNLIRGNAIVAGDSTEEFWALRDVSFEVRRGDVLGIIGRNGAGKSTLLKILSRITEPSEGRVTLEGRVASLLEVGTGFHPELSGRENIYLNGAIIGMTRAEIHRKFDEIVAFAEVDKFLDTPVKRYSSGMYVRLAFAVAAHLEPEILVIDEVLAVGDAEFQKKCLGKMSEVSSHGRTVLFVSHNTGAIRSLCTCALLLNNGKVERNGPVVDVVGYYARAAGSGTPSGSVDLFGAARRGSGAVKIRRMEFPVGEVALSFRIFEKLVVEFVLAAENPSAMASASVFLLIRNSLREDVMMIMQKDADCKLPRAGQATVRLSTTLGLAPGRYQISCGVIGTEGIVDWVDDACSFDVEAAFQNGSGFDGRLGMVLAQASWQAHSFRSPADNEPSGSGAKC